MSPISHFLIGWTVANVESLGAADRAAITIASVAPDIDGVGIVAEYLTKGSTHPLAWYSDYHHILGHNVVFSLVVSVAVFGLADQKWRTAALALLAFHLHLLADVAGSRGPDGYQWPILYLSPFSAWQWTWRGQWELNSYSNYLITGLALLVCFYLALRRGYSPVGLVSRRADEAFVGALRQRFGDRGDSPRGNGYQP